MTDETLTRTYQHQLASFLAVMPNVLLTSTTSFGIAEVLRHGNNRPK